MAKIKNGGEKERDEKKKAPSTSSILCGISLTFHAVGFAGGAAAQRRHDILVGGIMRVVHCAARNKRQNINYRLHPHLLNARNGLIKRAAAEGALPESGEVVGGGS